MLRRLPMDSKPSIKLELQFARAAVRPHSLVNSHNIERLWLTCPEKADAVVLSLFALAVVAAVSVHQTNTPEGAERSLGRRRFNYDGTTQAVCVSFTSEKSVFAYNPVASPLPRDLQTIQQRVTAVRLHVCACSAYNSSIHCARSCPTI